MTERKLWPRGHTDGTPAHIVRLTADHTLARTSSPATAGNKTSFPPGEFIIPIELEPKRGCRMERRSCWQHRSLSREKQIEHFSMIQTLLHFKRSTAGITKLRKTIHPSFDN